MPTLTGTDHTGKDVPTEINGELLAMGKKWGWNILEAPVVWTMHATYILIAVIFGAPAQRWLRPHAPCARLPLPL